jgi:hypothetical protein
MRSHPNPPAPAGQTKGATPQVKHSEMRTGVLYGHSDHPDGNGLRAVMVLDSKQLFLSKRWFHSGEKRFHPVGGRSWRPRKGYLQDAVGCLALWADPEVLTSIDVEEARREALAIVNDSENDDAVEQK